MIRTLLALIITTAFAFAHDDADWIRQRGISNKAGELCCGEKDCGVMTGGKVETRPDGYHVDADFSLSSAGIVFRTYHILEIVPYSDATPSPDSKFWRCEWGGMRKCFFSPTPTF